MSKISIKTDFADGEKLFATQLNNNFLVIQAGINANEENLQEVIDDAIIELDNELEEITANRGWDWNGGDRVTFYKGDTQAIEDREIINGQLLYNYDTGETAMDDDGERIVTGSGNVVSISENEPTNSSTKIWVKPSKMVNYAASYVVDSMSGTDTDKAPSVNAVKNYVDEKSKEVYSTDEVIIGTWFNKPLYRKSFQRTGNLSNITNTGITDLDEVIDLKVNVKSSSGNQWRTIPWIYNASSYDSTFAGGAYVNSTGSTIGFQAGSALTATSKYNITILYTKTTD